jgi:hypothetical protein
MPYLVNGHLIADDRIRAEAVRMSHDLKWRDITDETERAKRIWAEAEFAAIDAMLVEQLSVTDPRAVDQAMIEQQLRIQKSRGNCRGGYDDRQLRAWIEWNLRLQRTASEMTVRAAKPPQAAIEAFYHANRTNFRGCAVFEASHIVKHINEQQSEEQARAGIEAALADLESGAAFAVVADRHSDCKDKGGDLGQFLAGTMVQEFEDAIRDLKPGQRTGIFRTPFGFHIAELRRKTPAGLLDLEEVQDDIERVLTKIEQHREYLRVVAELRTRADIRWISEAGKQPRNCEPEKPLQQPDWSLRSGKR